MKKKKHWYCLKLLLTTFSSLKCQLHLDALESLIEPYKIPWLSCTTIKSDGWIKWSLKKPQHYYKWQAFWESHKVLYRHTHATQNPAEMLQAVWSQLKVPAPLPSGSALTTGWSPQRKAYDRKQAQRLPSPPQRNYLLVQQIFQKVSIYCLDKIKTLKRHKENNTHCSRETAQKVVYYIQMSNAHHHIIWVK